MKSGFHCHWNHQKRHKPRFDGTFENPGREEQQPCIQEFWGDADEAVLAIKAATAQWQASKLRNYIHTSTKGRRSFFSLTFLLGMVAAFTSASLLLVPLFVYSGTGIAWIGFFCSIVPSIAGGYVTVRWKHVLFLATLTDYVDDKLVAIPSFREAGPPEYIWYTPTEEEEEV